MNEQRLLKIEQKLDHILERFKAEKLRDFRELRYPTHANTRIWAVVSHGKLKGAFFPALPVFDRGCLIGLVAVTHDEVVYTLDRYAGFFFTNPFIELP
jgi:hypothetical protein